MKKSLALEALVRLFDGKDSQILKWIMIQVEKAPHWAARSSAVKLLSYLGLHANSF